MTDIALIRISDPDSGPDWLVNKMPLEMRALRELDSDDGSQYILTELITSIEGPNVIITHLVVGARMIGMPLTGGVGGTPANVAYVSDQTLLTDKKIDFSKAEYVAIALASCIPKPPSTPQLVPKKRWQFWK